ncbi:SHOCT domain-containing protein [Natronobiforma cellulositropha]|uniref:SHOCT domain-containing protein n=1 Tax=Natronobiforma cellulositropha TaxID=1679076 RepID=UPI0021D5D369|nr:SHOCT domain-containing protein [Natronobiforma cellulositropha]
MAADDSLVRTLLIVIAVILLFPFLMMALMIPLMGVWGWGHMWNGTGTTWMWLIMSIAPSLVVLGIGYLLYQALRRSSERQTDPALAELRTAYARGDLSDEEFEERRERLRRDL